jgi:hypothetical protein
LTPTTLDVTKPCPGCSGSFRKKLQPTQAMRDKAVSTRLDSVPIPPTYDTAPLEDVLELGELWTCTGCGMPHRIKPTRVTAE